MQTEQVEENTAQQRADDSDDEIAGPKSGPLIT